MKHHEANLPKKIILTYFVVANTSRLMAVLFRIPARPA